MGRVGVVAMAISLSATLPSNNTFQLHSNHPLSHIFPKQSPPYNHNLSFSLLRRPNPIKRAINFSSSQSSITVSGSPGIASSEVSEDTTSLLDTIQVFDLNGNGVPISDLWKDRKAVVAFARHFGCVLCRKRADYLAAKKDIMDAAGVALVLIGPGSVDQVCADTVLRKVYADPSYLSYKALRFVSGVSTTFTPGAGLKIIQAYMEGYRQDWGLSFEKDTRTRGGWQQGGIIVAGPGKSNISYVHKDKEAGDDPDIEEIVQACCS
ncbi:hypothetical protein ACSBR2_034968 [Camellia fascicularis]